MRTQTFVLILSCLVIFLFKIHPVSHFDTYFGLAIGKFVVEHRALPWHEVFSWAAEGRAWIPYEWLAQTIVYLLYRAGGLSAISLWVAALYTTFFLTLYALFHVALSRDRISSFVLSFFTTASVYEFFVARPQAIAYTCLSATLFLLFHAIRNKKYNFLWLSLPITYLWVNSHASFILVPYLFFSYALVGLWTTRSFKTIFLFGVLNVLMTVLPPLWYKTYQLPWEFTSDLPFITAFVSEWGGLGQNWTYQTFVLILFITSLLTALVVTWMKKNRELRTRWILALPLVALALISLTAIRHVPIGTISSVIIIALFAPSFSLHGPKRFFLFACSIGIIIFSVFLGYQKRAPIYDTLWMLPSVSIEQDIQNLKNMKLQGHMFNEYAVGGFLIWELYPTYQVFFDGRADIYHLKELRDYWPLIALKKSSRDEFRSAEQQFLEKYNFSYAVVPLFSYNPLEHTAATLLTDTLFDDPNWRLAYMSDHFLVLIKNDGKNPQLFQSGAKYVTPLRMNVFRQGFAREATTEYEALLTKKESGLARSNLGFAYLALGENEKAIYNFTSGRMLNLQLYSPFLGLATVATDRHNTDEAIPLLLQALNLAPYRGEIYLLLSQNYKEKGEVEKAKEILEHGLNQNIDFLSRQKIVQMLNEVSLIPK